jgi:hypothetical protein
MKDFRNYNINYCTTCHALVAVLPGISVNLVKEKRFIRNKADNLRDTICSISRCIGIDASAMIDELKPHFLSNPFAAAVYVARLNNDAIEEAIDIIVKSSAASAYLVSNIAVGITNRECLDKLYESCLRKPASAYTFGSIHRNYNGDKIREACAKSTKYSYDYAAKVDRCAHDVTRLGVAKDPLRAFTYARSIEKKAHPVTREACSKEKWYKDLYESKFPIGFKP